MSTFHQARENLRMAAICPTWYDHLPKVEAAMAESDRIYSARTAAGWEMGEEGEWYAPDPATGELISQSDWEDLGLDYPEDAK